MYPYNLLTSQDLEEYEDQHLGGMIVLFIIPEHREIMRQKMEQFLCLPVHGSAASGGVNLSRPTGGFAYGIPRYCVTSLPVIFLR